MDHNEILTFPSYHALDNRTFPITSMHGTLSHCVSPYSNTLYLPKKY